MSATHERDAHDTEGLGLMARAARACVIGYQRVRAGRPSPCRFTPSCSAYAVEALETHGFVRGLALSARRLGRCHPWGGFGLDPVPAAGAPRRREPAHRHVNDGGGC